MFTTGKINPMAVSSSVTSQVTQAATHQMKTPSSSQSSGQGERSFRLPSDSEKRDVSAPLSIKGAAGELRPNDTLFDRQAFDCDTTGSSRRSFLTVEDDTQPLSDFERSIFTSKVLDAVDELDLSMHDRMKMIRELNSTAHYINQAPLQVRQFMEGEMSVSRLHAALVPDYR